LGRPGGRPAAFLGRSVPAYRFEALDAAGKSQSGLVEADNSRAARSQLRAQQLVPLAVTQVATEHSARSTPFACRGRCMQAQHQQAALSAHSRPPRR